MATYTATVPDFNLISTWVVTYDAKYVYAIAPGSGPTTASTTKDFTITGITAGSTINSAVLTATLGSPLTGAAIRTVAIEGGSNNGFSGSLDVTSAVAASFGAGDNTISAKFRFKANGVADIPVGNRSSSLAFRNVKITVDYTPPYTAPSVSNVTLAGGTGSLYAGAGTKEHVLAWTGTNGSYNAISKYLVYRSINGAAYVLISDQTATSLKVTAPATAGEYHRYYIVAVGEYSNSAAAYSPYLYAYKAPGAPTGVNLTPGTVYTGATTRVSWSAGAAGVGVGTSKYEVYRNGVLVGSSTGLYLDVTAPAAAGNYTYTVRAIGSISGYNSALSAGASLTVENPASTGSLDRTSVAMDGSSTIKITIASGNAAFTHKAIWKAGSASVTQNVAAGVASTTLTVPLAWCAQFPSATSGTASVVLETYNGATKTGERTYTFTVSVPASVVPSFTALTASIVANGIAITNRYVQGYSSVALAITSPAGAQGSSITKYAITGGGFTAAATQTTTFGKLNTAGTITFAGTITDSRGRTASKTVSITVQPYSAPSLSGVQAYRCNANGTKAANGLYVLLRATNVIASVDGQNTATLQGRVYMRGATPGAWQAMSSNANLITGGGNILIIKTYYAEIRITDKIGNYVYTATIPTDTILLHGLDGVQGAAIGKYAEMPKALEIPEDWSFRRGGYVGLDSGNYASYVTPAGIGAAPVLHNHTISNPNILHNWDFTNPINQRGLTTAVGAGYWLDRWKLNKTTGATYTYSTAWGLRSVTTTYAIIMEQFIENPNAYAGKTVTLSFEIYSASITSGCTVRLVYNGSTDVGLIWIDNGNTGIKSFTATIPSTELTRLSVVFTNYNGDNDVRIKRIKLELGTVSTLHLDPPMDYTRNFLDCARYYFVNRGIFTGSQNGLVCSFNIPLLVPMRILPTYEGPSTFNFCGGDGDLHMAESPYFESMSNGALVLRFTNATSLSRVVISNTTVPLEVVANADL